MTPVFHGQMNRTVTVRRHMSTFADQDGKSIPTWTECNWSPMPAAIQPASRASNGDAFYDRWPDATHSLWCAAQFPIEADDWLSWLEPGGTEVSACVIGEAESEHNGHHWRVPLREVPQ